jgi:hypothetical protein
MWVLKEMRLVKLRRMRWAGLVARMGEGRDVNRDLVGKPEGRRPLGRPRRRWEDNIKMHFQEVGGCCGDWMERAQDKGQVAGTCEYGNELSGSINAGNFLTRCKTS